MGDLKNVISAEARWENGGLRLVCPLCGADCDATSDEKATCRGVSPHTFDIMGIGSNCARLLEEAVKE